MQKPAYELRISDWISAVCASDLQPSVALLFALGFAFGGLGFALYPLCVAHVNDRLLSSERVTASGQLVLLYSGGAAFGPIGAAAAMTLAGAGGLFLFIALCAAAMTGFGLWRLEIGRAHV